MTATVDFTAPLHAEGDEDESYEPPLLGASFANALVRAKRRSEGIEKPIELPWKSLADHFGGGLWPGVHFVNAGTGLGKTQFALQVGTHAAKRGVPVLYIGLELGELDLALRVLGAEALVPWSYLWTGKAGPAHFERVRQVVPSLEPLPFHFEAARPNGFPSSRIRSMVTKVRARYPESTDADVGGPGSRPMLVIVDFLQLVGDEPNAEQDLRVRIGRASYVLRDVASRLEIAVLCISSVARDRYKLLNEIQSELVWSLDGDERPIDRHIRNPDGLVGTGKESGEIEYAADSVSVLARVPETWDGKGCDVVFATAKGRATGATWSPLHFTGFRYEECPDGGGRMVDAWKDAADRRERVREEKRTAKDDAKERKIEADAASLRAYVIANPGCLVTTARVNVVGDNPRRWTRAVARLAAALVQTPKGRTVSLSIADATADRGRSPPVPPPPSTSTVDGRGPTADRGVSGPSTVARVATVGSEVAHV